jgi:hypothetical protein
MLYRCASSVGSNGMAFVMGVSNRDGLFVVMLLEGRRWVSDGDDIVAALEVTSSCTATVNRMMNQGMTRSDCC